MDSHRSYFPDAADGPAYQPERGGSDPGYVPPVQHYGDNPSYRDVPTQAEPRAGYPPVEAQSPYLTPADPGGPRSADGASLLAMPVGPRSGEHLPPLPTASEGEPTSPTFTFVAEQAGPAFPPGPGAPAPVPPAFASAPFPPAFAPEPPPAFASAPVSPAYAPEPPPRPGTVHTGPTSGLPYVAGAATPATYGRPSSGDPRPVSAGSSWNGFDAADETQAVRRPAESTDRPAPRRPSGPGKVGDGVYRSRRPGLAAGIVAATVVFELIALRLLASAFFASNVQVGGSIASSFLVLGLPMFGFGLYGLLSGTAATPGSDLRAWLRPPLVYLPVALVLFVTAGLAAG